MSRLQKKAKKTKKPNHIISGQDLQKKAKFEGFGLKKAKLVTLLTQRKFLGFLYMKPVVTVVTQLSVGLASTSI